jgi:hypothetical protein
MLWMKIFLFNLISTDCTAVCYTLSVGAREYGPLSQVNEIYVCAFYRMKMPTKCSEIFLPVTQRYRKCFNKQFVPHTLKYRLNQIGPASASCLLHTATSRARALSGPSLFPNCTSSWSLNTDSNGSCCEWWDKHLYHSTNVQFSVMVCFPTSPPIYFLIVRILSGSKGL